MHDIYLDHNATTPPLPEVVAAMADCQAKVFANPSSQHRAGRQARRVLEDAREAIAEILDIRLGSPYGDRLIFTSGGSEANNLALFGLARGDGRLILISAIEHPSVARAAEALGRRGFLIEKLSVTPDGLVDATRLEAGDWRGGDSSSIPAQPPLRPPASSLQPVLAAVMLANNETGVIQPIEQIASVLAQRGVPLHCDAAQAVGKIPVAFHRLGAATMSIAAHKFQGPRGIGALAVRGGMKLAPQIFGGFQESELRAGTECVALAVGMRVALELWQSEADARQARMRELRDRLEMMLAPANIVVHGAGVRRLPNTLCASFPALDRQSLMMALDLAGVACSTGSACASGSSDPSPTLIAMGCAPQLVESALRFSVGATSTLAEIDAVAGRILQICRDLRGENRPRKSAAAARGRA